MSTEAPEAIPTHIEGVDERAHELVQLLDFIEEEAQMIAFNIASKVPVNPAEIPVDGIAHVEPSEFELSKYSDDIDFLKWAVRSRDGMVRDLLERCDFILAVAHIEDPPRFEEKDTKTKRFISYFSVHQVPKEEPSI